MKLVPYMVPMRTPGRGLLRTAMAVVFGFMSLVHGPVMTFAKASSGARSSRERPHHGSLIDHHAAPARIDSPQSRITAPVCYAFGCFIALDAVALRRACRDPQSDRRVVACSRGRAARRETSSPPFLLPVSTSELSEQSPLNSAPAPSKRMPKPLDVEKYQ